MTANRLLLHGGIPTPILRQMSESSAVTPQATIDPPRAAAPEPRRNRPGNILEDQLHYLWQQLLRTPEIGVRDDFFSVGGSPALYDQMLIAVERLCGHRLRPVDLGEEVTIRNLGQVLVARLSHEAVLEIQRGQPAVTPLVFIHGDVSGGGYYVRELARGLGIERPVYAPQQCGMRGEPLPSSVEEMAAGHIRDLTSLLPQGPVHLGGHCSGAIIALEMAAQWTRAGRHVRTLVMVEPPVRPPRIPVVPQLSDEQLRIPMLRGAWLFAQYCSVLAHYQAAPYSGRVAVFFAREAREGRRQLDQPDTRAALRTLAPAAEMFSTPGNHVSAPGRHIRALAAAMKACLSD